RIAQPTPPCTTRAASSALWSRISCSTSSAYPPTGGSFCACTSWCGAIAGSTDAAWSTGGRSRSRSPASCCCWSPARRWRPCASTALAWSCPSRRAASLGRRPARCWRPAWGSPGGPPLLLRLGAVGFSLFTGLSWLALSERVGHALEKGYSMAIEAWDRHRDRKLGALAREERTLVVQTEKRREEDHPPLRIEPAIV